LLQYTREAQDFFEANKGLAQPHQLRTGGYGLRIMTESHIDQTIDDRLERACLNPYADQTVLQRFLKYRGKMLELAKALERASGTPIRFKSTLKYN